MAGATFKTPVALWRHPNPEKTQMSEFMGKVQQKRGVKLSTYDDLYKWSVTDIPAFWAEIFDAANLIHEGTYSQVVNVQCPMDANPPWFQGIKLNHAENILFARPPGTPPGTRGTHHKADGTVAIVEAREGGTEIRNVTWAQVRSLVGLYSNALRASGVGKGDRVAVVASNSLKTVVAALATTTLAAIFSGSATDMGVNGIVDRLAQIEPKWVFFDDCAVWNGKKVDLRRNIALVESRMRHLPSFQGIVILPRFENDVQMGIEGVDRVLTLDEFLKRANGDDTLSFTRIDFNEPMGIMYSSGTTGTPKCIVHRVGGGLVMSYKEIVLHYDRTWNDCVLQYTTVGWIMFHSSLANMVIGARTILYDGSPFVPNPLAFLKLAADQKVTHLGISPRYLQELYNHKIYPRDLFDFSHLVQVTSTGMVLSETLFEWFYEKAFPPRAQLTNLTGGTDVAAGFAAGDPLTEVYAGGFQSLALGFKVEVYDASIGEEGGPVVEGRPVKEPGEQGELVVTAPFPTMPVTFWGPGGHMKYMEAYFSRFRSVWTHGDFISFPPPLFRLHLHGRSDGVLNPSGVRFGSSEVYNILSTDPSVSPHILDALLVGQRRKHDTNESLILFITPRAAALPPTQARRLLLLPPALITAIQRSIGTSLSKRHIPTHIFSTPAPLPGAPGMGDSGSWIPYTINGKKVEAPVKKIVCLGKRIVPSSTIANPACLPWYEQFFHIEDVVAAGGPTTMTALRDDGNRDSKL